MSVAMLQTQIHLVLLNTIFMKVWLLGNFNVEFKGNIKKKKNKVWLSLNITQCAFVYRLMS